MLQQHQLEPYAREHISFERWMLDGIVAEWLANSHRYSQIVRNLMLEGVMLHARNLDDFLAGNRTNPLPGRGKAYDDDVIATDYSSTWTPTAALTPADRDLANKKIAHLTTARDAKEPIDAQRIRDQVAYQFTAFLAVLDEHQRAWFGPGNVT